MNSSKPVLLQVIPSLAFGGAEIQTLQQMNYLHQNGVEVYLLVLSKVHEYPTEVYFPKNHIEVLGFAYDSLQLGAVQKSRVLMKPILQFIEKRKITHVIAQLPLSHFVMRLVKIRQKLFRLPSFLLFNYHRAIQYKENPLDTFGKKVFNRANHHLAKSADHGNIFVSQAAYENISQHIFVRNAKIIHNVVAENRVDTTLALQYLQKHAVEMPDFLMVLPGRVLAKVKGHHLLVDAFQQLQKKYEWKPHQVKIIFAGGGSSIPTLKEEIATVHLGDYFHFTDFIANPLLLSFLKLANVVVIPSIAEGFGNVAVEALMQQSNILCSDAGGLKEIITDGYNGWVFEAGNIAQLSEKLSFLYEHRQETLLDKNLLLEDYRERFTVEAQMQKLLGFLLQKK